MGEGSAQVVSIVDDDASLRRSVWNRVTSVGMPGRSGLNLLRGLVAAGSRVVMLTAHGDEETRRRALQAGVVAFLGTPFRGDALLDAVRMALVTAGAS